MRFLPYSLLKPRGIGSAHSCLSRATEIIEKVVRLCEDNAGFRFSIDTVWALDQVARRSGLRERIGALLDQGKLSVGSLWAGSDWIPHTECLFRDLECGRDSLTALGFDSRTIVWHSENLEDLYRFLPAAGVDRVVLPGAIGTREQACPEILSVHGDLGLRFASSDPAIARDAERELGEIRGDVPLGEESWCPSDQLLSDLEERASDAGADMSFVIWDQSDEIVGSAEERGARVASHLEATLPGVHVCLAEVSNTLLRTERILAMATLLGGPPARTDDLVSLWKQHLEDLSGHYTGSGDRVKREELSDSCSEILIRARRLQYGAEYGLALSADAGSGPEGIVPIVVFNPSAYVRSEAVVADILYYGEHRATQFDRYEFYKLVDAQGTAVPVEEIDGKQIETAEIRVRFLAKDVPSLGYKTFYLVPKPREDGSEHLMPMQAPGVMTPDFPEPVFAIDDVDERVSAPRRGLRLGRSFTAGPFVLCVDDITGCIDIDDRKRDTRLVAGLRLQAREDRMDSDPGVFSPTGRVLPHVIHGVDLVESGEVSARLHVSGRIGSSSADLLLRVYGDLPIVDVVAEISWKDSHPALIELAASLGDTFHEGCRDLGLGAAGWQAAGPGGWGERWITARAPGSCLTLSSDTNRIEIEGGDVRSPLLFSSPDVASYAYNKVWMSYPERVTYGFRLRLSDIEDVTQAREFSEPFSIQCVYDRSAVRTRPAEASGLSVNTTSAQVSSIRPVRDGVELRAFDVLGEGGSASWSSGDRSGAAERVSSGDLVDVKRELRFSPSQIRTILIETREGQ